MAIPAQGNNRHSQVDRQERSIVEEMMEGRLVESYWQVESMDSALRARHEPDELGYFVPYYKSKRVAEVETGVPRETRSPKGQKKELSPDFLPERSLRKRKSLVV